VENCYAACVSVENYFIADSCCRRHRRGKGARTGRGRGEGGGRGVANEAAGQRGGWVASGRLRISQRGKMCQNAQFI